MGKTSFSGPVWGAKSLLFSVQGDKGQGSSVAVTLGAVVVPPGEDWYITDFCCYRGSTESTGAIFALLDDSTSVATVSFASSVAGLTGSTQPTPDGGEYMGVRVAENSTLSITFIAGNSTLASSGLKGYVYGFPRWLQTSTRGF
jgi:hypothetical protein